MQVSDPPATKCCHDLAGKNDVEAGLSDIR